VASVRKFFSRVAFSALGQPTLLKRKIEHSARLGRLTILTFHRVAPPDGSAYPPLRPDLFEEALRFCARHFELVQFGSLTEYAPSKKPLAIISFDDGYYDFLEYALPILRRHDVRCNHNLIPYCLRSGLPPINILVQDFIGKAPAEQLEAIDQFGWTRRPSSTDRLAAGLQVSRAIKSKPIDEQRALASQLSQSVDLETFATRMMSVDDARSISDEVEIGAHSFEHASLSAETDEYIENDATRCLDFFEQELRAPTEIYALPNGDGAKRAAPILRKVGFRHILLTAEQYSDPELVQHSRFTMTGSSRAEVRYRSTGFVRN